MWIDQERDRDHALGGGGITLPPVCLSDTEIRQLGN
jgi:hypothetical protein